MTQLGLATTLPGAVIPSMSSLRTLALAYLPPLDPSSDFETVCRGLAADGISRVVLQEVCGTINLTDPGSGPRLARVLRDTGLQAIACHGLEHAPFLLRQPEFDVRRRIPNNIRRERSMPGILRPSTRPAAACGCRHDGDHSPTPGPVMKRRPCILERCLQECPAGRAPSA
jgi:hypothetical protein